MSGDRPTIQERYRSATRSSNLKSVEKTTRADSDVLGAYGLAARQLEEGYVRTGPGGLGHAITPAPLAVPLERFIAGDSSAAHVIVTHLSEMAWGKGKSLRVEPRLTRSAAHDMGCIVLAWFRNGTCKPCGGHGYDLIPGVPSLSDNECTHCEGTGKRNLEGEFPMSHRDIVRWLAAQMELALNRAGPQAMQTIAPRLEL